MNVALRNENEAVMNSLDVEIIKTMNGTFAREDLEREFINLSYNKVIIDITSIRNYFDENTLFNFLTYWEPSRVVLVLNNTEFCNNPAFLKKLVEKGFYNFTKNASGASFLVNRPNNLDDVRKFLEGATLYDSNNSNEITAEENYSVNRNKHQRIIGLQGLTNHAGATTLMYMMCKMLKTKKTVKGIEVGSKDSTYFKSEDIITSDSIEDLKIKVKTLYTLDVIIIDLNGVDGLDICDEILYLLEPGTVRLNKLLKSGQNISELSNRAKIVLTRSALKESDVAAFEYETKIKVFANVTDFNERLESSKTVNNLLVKLKL